MKFKKGDKVKALHDEPKGMIGEVVEVNSRANNNCYLCRFKGFKGHNGKMFTLSGNPYPTYDYWYMDEDELEHIKSNQTIVIYRKDSTMVALDKVTGEKAVAKCSPQDTFDYKVGAKLAFSRLIGEEEETTGNFKVLCVKDTYLGSNLVFKKGKLYDYVNGSCLREDGHTSGKYKDFTDLIKHNRIYKDKLFEVKEVKRFAKPGEYVKVVNATGTLYDEYCNGDILRIVNENFDLNNNILQHAYYKNESKKYLDTCEYVVLEGDYPKEVEESINVGDTVKVIDIGRTYDTYGNWSGLVGYTNNFIRRGTPENDKKYKVLELGTHGMYEHVRLALIQNPTTKQVFIINVEGLEKC